MKNQMIVSIIGRPNVGKSSLFNRLMKHNKALTHDSPGVTRDRHYGIARIESGEQQEEITLVDTGGFYPKEEVPFEENSLFCAIREHSQSAAEESDLILFVVDCREGILPVEYQIVKIIRELQKPFWIVVNKFDSYAQEGQEAQFYALGIHQDRLYPVSSAHNLGINRLTESLYLQASNFAPNNQDKSWICKNVISKEDHDSHKVAIVGMPNSGKSTLLNQMLGQNRALVSDIAGTTVDPVEGRCTLESNGRTHHICFVDTAGIRKKSAPHSYIEQHSVYRALRCISESNVVLYLVDSTKGIGRQDKRLLDVTLEKGKSLIICLNKIDLINYPQHERDQWFLNLKDTIPWADFCELLPLCAKTGKGLRNIKAALIKTLSLRKASIPTGELNRFFSKAVSNNPIVVQKSKGVRLKIKYASMVKSEPPTFLLFSNRSRGIPQHYKRYLKNTLRKTFSLENTPIHLVFRTQSQ